MVMSAHLQHCNIIDFGIEVGVLGWVSTAIFWVAVVVAVWKIIKVMSSKL